MCWDWMSCFLFVFFLKYIFNEFSIKTTKNIAEEKYSFLTLEIVVWLNKRINLKVYFLAFFPQDLSTASHSLIMIMSNLI